MVLKILNDDNVSAGCTTTVPQIGVVDYNNYEKPRRLNKKRKKTDYKQERYSKSTRSYDD